MQHPAVDPTEVHWPEPSRAHRPRAPATLQIDVADARRLTEMTGQLRGTFG